VNLDGTLIHTERIAARGPNGADLRWSGKHKDHGGNIQVLSYPDGFPCRVSEVRPGREHGIPTLTYLGYLSLSPAIRHPFKKPKSEEPTDEQKKYNDLFPELASGEGTIMITKTLIR
jgi:DDE superfamily endonuclease